MLYQVIFFQFGVELSSSDKQMQVNEYIRKFGGPEGFLSYIVNNMSFNKIEAINVNPIKVEENGEVRQSNEKPSD